MSSSSLSFFPCSPRFSSLYLSASLASAANKPIEHRAAIRIQRAYRGYRARATLLFFHRCAVAIQRLYRGRLGRRHANIKRNSGLVIRQLFVRDSAAVLIQKVMRGFLSRKHFVDFYSRRRYLAATVDRADDLHRQAKQEADTLIMIRSKEAEEKQHADFSRATVHVHHLLSTRGRPGVLAKRTAAQRPIEEHIKEAAKERTQTLERARRTIHLAATDLARSLHASSIRSPLPPLNGRTNQEEKQFHWTPKPAPVKSVDSQLYSDSDGAHSSSISSSGRRRWAPASRLTLAANEDEQF